MKTNLIDLTSSTMQTDGKSVVFLCIESQAYQFV